MKLLIIKHTFGWFRRALNDCPYVGRNNACHFISEKPKALLSTEFGYRSINDW